VVIQKRQLQDYGPFDMPAVRAAQGERTFYPPGGSKNPFVVSLSNHERVLPIQLSFLGLLQPLASIPVVRLDHGAKCKIRLAGQF
jgi:hypothetical protein